jgi:uncharacterized protein YjbI with pentapeptide repeats
MAAWPLQAVEMLCLDPRWYGQGFWPTLLRIASYKQSYKRYFPMPNPEHLAILKEGVENRKEGVEKWNEWREENSEVMPDLSGANFYWAHLSRANLYGANLSRADLVRANLSGANLSRANLQKANLNRAHLNGADLSGASLREANLVRANLNGADLSGARLRGANLSRADLSESVCTDATFEEAIFIGTNLQKANLTGVRIYGISAWDLRLTNAVQRNLIITPSSPIANTNIITVDDVEVAQFIYLLLNNKRIRNVIDTITSKVVLILGRFTPKRKPVLDAVREDLRKRDYLPIVFDFEKPSSRDLTETVSTLAHMAKFIIADLTEAKSLPQELMRVVPSLPSVPVQPILLASRRKYAMFEHFTNFPWVLPVVPYETKDELLANLAERVIGPAERRLATAKTGEYLSAKIKP